MSSRPRRGLFVAPFDALADPAVVGDLAARAEAAGWEGLFVWDHLQYGDRVRDIADPWTCCAAVAMRTQRMITGPMVTPLARRRPQVVARQAESLARLSGGRFVLGLGLGDDWVGEFSDYGDEADPRARAKLLDAGLAWLAPRLPGVPIWLAGRHPNAAPVRRAAHHDGFFVIGLSAPADVDVVRRSLTAHEPRPGFDLVIDLQPDQDPTPWLGSGASWVLTRIGPYDIDLDTAFGIADAGPA